MQIWLPPALVATSPVDKKSAKYVLIRLWCRYAEWIIVSSIYMGINRLMKWKKRMLKMEEMKTSGKQKQRNYQRV